MATLTIAKPIQYYHPKYSFDMRIKEIPEIDKRNKIYNSHITFENGEPCLNFPMRAKFIFDKIETPTFQRAYPTDDYTKANSNLKGEINIPLQLKHSGDIITVGLLSMCIATRVGIEYNLGFKLGFKDYQDISTCNQNIRGYYSHICIQSPICKAIVSHFNSNPEISQEELINFLKDYVGDSDVFVCVKKFLRIQYVGNTRCYLKPFYYLEYYFPDSLELPFKDAMNGLCPLCLSNHNFEQIVIGKKIRRANDQGVNYICTGLGAGVGALIAGPIGAVVGGAVGKIVGDNAEGTNSSMSTYEFECPKCHHKWIEER